MDAITIPVTVQIIMIAAAYLLGSVNSALLVCRAMSLPDPRASGSGNPGATNVLRTGSKSAAAITLCGDLLKGLLPVLLVNALAGGEHLAAVVGLAAILGHIYPVYYRFQGGKGVATTLGALLGLLWPLGTLWAIVWIIVASLFRYSALAALVATFIMLCYAWFLPVDTWVMGVLSVITALIFWRHRSNIRNLLAGNEARLGEK